jgi:hypothetical protein
VQHYNRGRPHASLGPGIPDRPSSVAPRSIGQLIPHGYRVAAIPILGGLHHEYRLEAATAWFLADHNHYINNLLVDGHFDPEQPEVLLYAARPGEDGLRLVALEYISPDTFPVPEGFTGDDDVWQLEEPLPIWVLNAWIWLHNPNGTFTFLNPHVPWLRDAPGEIGARCTTAQPGRRIRDGASPGECRPLEP